MKPQKSKQTASPLELARQILNRDGIRPLLGKAFTQTELEILDAALRQESEEKAAFNIAVQTQRPQLVAMIKQPLFLTVDEARSLANDLIALKFEAQEWKDKWLAKKDTMNDWLNSAIEATNHLNSITTNRKV